MIGDRSMLSTLCDDLQSMASLRECDVPPNRLVTGHRHRSHWKRNVVVVGIGNGRRMAYAGM